MDGKYCLVTDSHRGIYFGKIEETLEGGAAVRMSEARHCFYYVAGEGGQKGTFSLATAGPQDGSHVGPELKNMVVRSVATVSECTEKAVKAWQKAGW